MFLIPDCMSLARSERRRAAEASRVTRATTCSVGSPNNYLSKYRKDSSCTTLVRSRHSPALSRFEIVHLVRRITVHHVRFLQCSHRKDTSLFLHARLWSQRGALLLHCDGCQDSSILSDISSRVRIHDRARQDSRTHGPKRKVKRGNMI